MRSDPIPSRPQPAASEPVAQQQHSCGARLGELNAPESWETAAMAFGFCRRNIHVPAAEQRQQLFRAQGARRRINVLASSLESFKMANARTSGVVPSSICVTSGAITPAASSKSPADSCEQCGGCGGVGSGESRMFETRSAQAQRRAAASQPRRLSTPVNIALHTPSASSLGCTPSAGSASTIGGITALLSARRQPKASGHQHNDFKGNTSLDDDR